VNLDEGLELLARCSTRPVRASEIPHLPTDLAEVVSALGVPTTMQRCRKRFEDPIAPYDDLALGLPPGAYLRVATTVEISDEWSAPVVADRITGRVSVVRLVGDEVLWGYCNRGIAEFIASCALFEVGLDGQLFEDLSVADSDSGDVEAVVERFRRRYELVLDRFISIDPSIADAEHSEWRLVARDLAEDLA
jgi:hypothetical protein